jgi:hypothetical protein
MGAPFANCFTRWIQSVFKATDGDNHMVIAWSTANGVVLGQEKIMKSRLFPNCLIVWPLRNVLSPLMRWDTRRISQNKLLNKKFIIYLLSR